MIQGRITSTAVDRTKDLMDALKNVLEMEVFVGIPEEKAGRLDDTGVLNNAQLAFLHTQGVRSAAMRSDMKADLDEGTKYSEALSLYIQSHGSPIWHIHPRPMIEPAIEAEDNKEKIAAELKEAAKMAMEGNKPEAVRHLETAGMIGQNVVRDWFEDPRNDWPPLAQSTIDTKKSDSPLIDTGQLRKAITYVVKE